MISRVLCSNLCYPCRWREALYHKMYAEILGCPHHSHKNRSDVLSILMLDIGVIVFGEKCELLTLQSSRIRILKSY